MLVNWLSPNTPPPSPCCRRASLLILPPSGQVIPSSPKRFLPTITPCLPLILAPTCCPVVAGCLQPTPLIHDQRIRRVREETYLTDKSGYNRLFAASTVCAVVASVNISTGSPLAPPHPACSAGLKRSFSTSHPPCQPAHRGRFGTPSRRSTSAVCKPVGHHRTWGGAAAGDG